MLIVLSFYDRVAPGSVHADITSSIYTHTALGICTLSSRSINLYAVNGAGVSPEFFRRGYLDIWSPPLDRMKMSTCKENLEKTFISCIIYIFVYYAQVETVVGPGGRSRNTSSGCGQRPMQVPSRNEYEQRIRK